MVSCDLYFLNEGFAAESSGRPDRSAGKSTPFSAPQSGIC
uniref:Uncharacterized protein n=1 Tax=Anguilla anguilla TaxID=7936 RepID=A0A0E9U8I8_ANGAN